MYRMILCDNPATKRVIHNGETPKTAFAYCRRRDLNPHLVAQTGF